MFGEEEPPSEHARPQHNQAPPWHAQAGDGVADTYNVPGILLFGLGIGFLAATLTAAGYGYGGWALICAAATLVLWACSISILLIEHAHERAAEQKYGRQGRFRHGRMA